MDTGWGMLSVLDDLVRYGVPIERATRALRIIEEGGSVRDAADACEVPTLDEALQARAEASVVRAEAAVRDRAKVRVRHH